MEHTSLFMLLALGALACTKSDDATPSPLPGMGCGSDGHRIELAVDAGGWCASANVSAMASIDGDAIITGVALSGQLFALQIDSMAPGTFTINEAANAASWTEGGNTFTSTTIDPGTLMITMHDASTLRLNGTIDVVLHDDATPASRHLTGEFDVTYTVQ